MNAKNGTAFCAKFAPRLARIALVTRERTAK
jgi:hypothetical protein